MWAFIYILLGPHFGPTFGPKAFTSFGQNLTQKSRTDLQFNYDLMDCK